MTEKITQRQYLDFKSYMRSMIKDIARAKSAEYINAPHMQEVAIVWNEGNKPKLEGYPRPDNLTHYPYEPHLNHLEAGEYVFKRVIQNLMVKAGFKGGEDMFISEFKPGEFDCNMYSSLEKVGGKDSYDYASRIDCFFIRVNGDMDKAKDFFKKLDNATLDAACREVLEDMNFEIVRAPRKRRQPAPGM